MKLKVLSNFELDNNIKSSVLALSRKLSFKYHIKGEVIDTGFRNTIPHIHEITLFVFVHPRSDLQSFLKKLVTVIKSRKHLDVVCIVGTSIKAAFPGTFGITQFCQYCGAMLEYFAAGRSFQPGLCNCNNGPLVSIYPSQFVENYFAFSEL